MKKNMFLKFILVISFSVFVRLVFIGWTKENITKTTARNNECNSPIEGLWIGTYTQNGQPQLGERYFSLAIRPGGTMISDGKVGKTDTNLSTGTWTLTGDTLKCSFTCVYGLQNNVGVLQSYIAILDQTGKLTGKWNNFLSPASSGVINLRRVNQRNDLYF
jgi:hypothetical protein